MVGTCVGGAFVVTKTLLIILFDCTWHGFDLQNVPFHFAKWCILSANLAHFSCYSCICYKYLLFWQLRALWCCMKETLQKQRRQKLLLISPCFFLHFKAIFSCYFWWIAMWWWSFWSIEHDEFESSQSSFHAQHKL